jgi:hypothetical protein
MDKLYYLSLSKTRALKNKSQLGGVIMDKTIINTLENPSIASFKE